MRNFTLLFLSCLLASMTLSAAPITPEQALQRVAKSHPTRSSELADLKYASTVELPSGDAALYIFDNVTEPGYAILSADDVAAPLLGYSNTNKYDEKSMSPEMKWWLEGYAKQIEYAKSIGASPYKAAKTRADREAIAPMIATRWNQNNPYNLQTPEINGKHSVTGCVATAMAQVMKYWNYPAVGSGIGTCTVRISDEKIDTLTMNFKDQSFDWENMLDKYSSSATEVQKSAVAYLMKACGYGAQMQYTNYESSAALYYAAYSLVQNFGYNENIQYCERDYYTASEWTDMIYGELAAGRPVAYGGQSTQGGHAFVCDGYQSDGYFHFNWGWGGMSDGYFLLNALNPNSLGIGANGGGYNFGQNAIVGIQPTTGAAYPPNFAQSGNIEGKALLSSITLSATGEYGGWYNMSTLPIIIDIAAKIEPIAPTTGETTYINIIQKTALQPNYGYKKLEVDVKELKNGTYRLTMCYKLSSETEWTPVHCESQNYNFFEFTKEGSKVTVKDNAEALPIIEKAEFTTPLYYGDLFKMALTVSNPSSKEITNSFYPALYLNEEPQMTADGLTITLAPGETVTKEISGTFEMLGSLRAPTAETAYTLYFYDPASYDNADTYLELYRGFSKEVTMGIDNFGVNLDVENYIIKGYEQDSKGFYNVTNGNYIPFSVDITNNAEYFAKAVNIVIFPYIVGQNVYSVMSATLSPLATLTKGEKATLTAVVDFSEGEVGKNYFALLYVDGNELSGNQILFTLSAFTGVEGIAGEEMAIFYDKSTSTLHVSEGLSRLVVTAMNGTSYDMTSQAAGGSVDLNELPAGIYVVNAFSTDGVVKTLKIMR